MNQPSGKETHQILQEMKDLLFPENTSARKLCYWTPPDGTELHVAFDKNHFPCWVRDKNARYYTLEGAFEKVLSRTDSESSAEDYYPAYNYLAAAIASLFYQKKTYDQILISTWERAKTRKASHILQVLNRAIDVAQVEYTVRAAVCAAHITTSIGENK